MIDGQATRQLERNPPVASVVNVSANQDANSAGPDALRVSELFPAKGAPASRPQVWSDIGYRPEPYVQQWNFSIQQALAGNTVLELGYIGSKGTRMVFYSQGNQATLDPDPSRPTPLVSRQPFPLFGSEIRTTQDAGNSTYHAGWSRSSGGSRRVSRCWRTTRSRSPWRLTPTSMNLSPTSTTWGSIREEAFPTSATTP